MRAIRTYSQEVQTRKTIRPSYNSGRPVHYAMAQHEPQYLEYPYYTEPPSVYAWQAPPQTQAFRPPQQPGTRPPPKQIMPPPRGNVFKAEILSRQFTAARIDAR